MEDAVQAVDTTESGPNDSVILVAPPADFETIDFLGAPVSDLGNAPAGSGEGDAAPADQPADASADGVPVDYVLFKMVDPASDTPPDAQTFGGPVSDGSDSFDFPPKDDASGSGDPISEDPFPVTDPGDGGEIVYATGEPGPVRGPLPFERTTTVEDHSSTPVAPEPEEKASLHFSHQGGLTSSYYPELNLL